MLLTILMLISPNISQNFTFRQTYQEILENLRFELSLAKCRTLILVSYERS